MPPYEDSLVFDVTEDEYKILKGITTSSMDSQALIADALATPNELLLVGDCEVFELLSGNLRSAVKCERNSKKRAILNVIYICGRLDKLLVDSAPMEATTTRDLPIHYN